MKKLEIITRLQGKEDVFRVLAVAHATGKPVLLVGPPGTGKTRALLDYSFAVYNDPTKTHEQNRANSINNSFILETDEDTKASEVKGRIDMKKLLEQNMYDLTSPIASAKFVLINEVEKASSGLRNSLLSVMNEKVLFNGIKKLKCHWELFCASCNSINKDEAEAPFWDRFVFKTTVSRITPSQITSYLIKGNKEKKIFLNLPEKEEIEQLASTLPEDKLKIFVKELYPLLTDRTLSYTPEIIAAVAVIYDLNPARAMVQTASLLAGSNVATTLAQKLEPAEVAFIRAQIELIVSMTDYDSITQAITKIEKEVVQLAGSGKLQPSDIEELQVELTKVLDNNSAYTPSEDAVSDLSTRTSGDIYQNTTPKF